MKDFVVKKRIITLGVMLIMFFSLFACSNTVDLQSQIHDLKEQSERRDDRIAELEAGNKILEEKIAELEEELEGLRTIYEIETEDIIELHTWFFTSGIPNNAIKFNYIDENAIFQCTVDNGQFWVKALGQYAKNAVIKSGDTIYWHGLAEDSTVEFVEQAFVDIILKIDNNIIGYAVIEISKSDNPHEHVARLLKSALIPKVDGKYQKISERQIKNVIEKIKNG